MAILDPRNIVADGPDVFSRVAAIGIDPLSSSAEGSPIYLTIDASVAVSGSYTVGTVTYDYSGITSVTQRTRESIRIDAGVDMAGENYEIVRDHDPSSFVDFGVIYSSTENTFFATQAHTLGCNGGTPPFAPPTFLLAPSIIEYIEGTSTDTDPDPDSVQDEAIELSVSPPYFTGSIQAGDLEMIVRLLARVNEGTADEYIETFDIVTDASAWTSLDFRDIRGTYGTTSYDANGIEYIWSVTVG